MRVTFKTNAGEAQSQESAVQHGSFTYLVKPIQDLGHPEANALNEDEWTVRKEGITGH